jgi:hypothetical protein
MPSTEPEDDVATAAADIDPRNGPAGSATNSERVCEVEMQPAGASSVCPCGWQQMHMLVPPCAGAVVFLINIKHRNVGLRAGGDAN